MWLILLIEREDDKTGRRASVIGKCHWISLIVLFYSPSSFPLNLSLQETSMWDSTKGRCLYEDHMNPSSHELLISFVLWVWSEASDILSLESEPQEKEINIEFQVIWIEGNIRDGDNKRRRNILVLFTLLFNRSSFRKNHCFLGENLSVSYTKWCTFNLSSLESLFALLLLLSSLKSWVMTKNFSSDLISPFVQIFVSSFNGSVFLIKIVKRVSSNLTVTFFTLVLFA